MFGFTCRVYDIKVWWLHSSQQLVTGRQYLSKLKDSTTEVVAVLQHLEEIDIEADTIWKKIGIQVCTLTCVYLPWSMVKLIPVNAPKASTTARPHMHTPFTKHPNMYMCIQS